ncbi:hypothetical protein I4U23_009362 [Adineta vaga]|nr:hypothetical protein I4U23_009362 [Adineta vaga]
MGSRLSRSSSSGRSEGSKSKWKKGKRKNAEKLEEPIQNDKFLLQNIQERKNSVDNLNESFEKWNQRIDQHDLQNFNVDPPGAPSTFATNYSMTQNDGRERTWSSPQDLTNHFYQGNTLPIAATSSINYDINNYMPTQISTTINNQTQQILAEERLSKKVQFARAMQQQQQQQQQIFSKNPLTNTQSWHESSPTNIDISTLSARQEQISNRQNLNRSAMPASNSSTNQVTVQKPIYVGIDHKATLAERGQTTTHRRHHKSVEKTTPDMSVATTINHRTRSHAHHQHKHPDTNEIVSSKPTIKPNKSFERLQAKLSGSNRPANTTTIIANKQAQHPEQSNFNDSETRVTKTRSNRHTQSQHGEQQILVDNEIRSSKIRASHSHSKQPQQQAQQRNNGSRNNSPLRTEISRRIDNKHQSAPIMKISIPHQQQQQQQQRQKQSTTTSGISTPPGLNRTRV